MTGPTGPGAPVPLGELLAQGEREALRGTPGRAVAPLRRALDLAAEQGQRTEGLAAGWLLGVAFGACGRYGEAFEVLEPLTGALAVAGHDAGTALFGALSAATSASLHRQLGRHVEARDLDAAGWAGVAALGTGADEARIDCALGLASDLVGLAERALAEQWAERAAAVVESRSDPGWRSVVRLDWVRAELALLDDDPVDAVEFADSALRAAERARAPRHVAKSLLFRGVSLATVDPARALSPLRRAATLADGLGARQLVWPARALLGALLGPEGGDELAAAAAVVRAITDGLPARYQADWLARPDVAALLEQGPPAAG